MNPHTGQVVIEWIFGIVLMLTLLYGAIRLATTFHIVQNATPTWREHVIRTHQNPYATRSSHMCQTKGRWHDTIRCSLSGRTRPTLRIQSPRIVEWQKSRDNLAKPPQEIRHGIPTISETITLD